MERGRYIGGAYMPTSQIIVTSRYIKSGSKSAKSKRANYTKYIATRETVEKREQNSPGAAVHSTQKQEQLIKELLTEFPVAKTYLEYEDYASQPTTENASELITTIIERHADVIGNRRNFVGYMANRPGAERRGMHGLFNDSNAPIDLKAVADEVANHPGIVWTHVVSLRREDAVRLGYTNSDMWRELVKRHITDIAQAQKIPLANLKWYAAFHNTTHHPHIHMIVYSTNPKQGYLTKEGIDKIRSVFANDIFQDELKSIYQQQIETRNELKSESEEQMKDILSEIGMSEINEQLVGMIMQLRSQLQTAKGKKVYGYLPKNIKQTVDSIFAMLAQDERIVKLYEKWCEFERAKYKTYTLKPKSFPPLTENKEFWSVKNMIIRTVLAMDDPIIMDEAMPEPPEPTDYSKLAELVNNKHGLYKYGKALLTGDEVAPAANLGEELLQEAVSLGNKNAERYLALEYISGEHIEQDIDKGVEMLTELADNGDTLSAYNLGKIYLSGEFVYADLNKAEHYLRQAADNDYEYAMYVLAKLYLSGEKKDLAQAVEWLEKACEYDSVKPHAAYTYAKILLDDSEFHDAGKAIRLLEENADRNSWCSYLLGKLQLFGTDEIEQDMENAKEMLKKSADDGNEYAEALYRQADDYEHSIMTGTAISLFAHLARIIRDNDLCLRSSNQPKVDRKLRREIEQKKENLGIKMDNSIHIEY